MDRINNIAKFYLSLKLYKSVVYQFTRPFWSLSKLDALSVSKETMISEIFDLLIDLLS